MKKLKNLTYVLVVAMFALFGGLLFSACDGKNKLYEVDIEYEYIQNGTVSVDKNLAKAGEIITVNYQAATGYELASITYNGLAVNGNTFVMPAHDVEIMAFFTLKSDETINLTLGDYVCNVFGYSDKYSDSSYFYDFTNVLRVKANNKMDYRLVLNEQIIEKQDVDYSRHNNEISVNILGQNFKAKIIDSETIFVETADNDVLIFTHQDTFEIANGTYNAQFTTLEEVEMQIELTINGNAMTLKMTENGQGPETKESTYTICGDRLYFDIDETHYVAILDEDLGGTSQNFSITRLGSLYLSGEYMEYSDILGKNDIVTFNKKVA